MSEDVTDKDREIQASNDRLNIIESIRAILLETFDTDQILALPLVEFALNTHVIRETETFWNTWDVDFSFDKDYRDFTVPLIMKRNLDELIRVNELFGASTYTRHTNFFAGGKEVANGNFQMIYEVVLMLTAQAILEQWYE